MNMTITCLKRKNIFHRFHPLIFVGVPNLEGQVSEGGPTKVTANNTFLSETERGFA